MKINYKKIISPLLLILAAIIWGAAFVAQKTGGESIGPFALTASRSFLGGLVLIPVIALLGKKAPQPKIHGTKKDLILGGVLCGTVLFAATAFQQTGLTNGTDAGKAGFITALYIVLVPVFSIFLGKKTSLKIWLGVIIAVAGLYFLCVSGTMSIAISDLTVLVCALIFAVHILVIDYFSPRVECLKMSCIQFFVCGILSLIAMVIFSEKCTLEALLSALIPILYLGIMSSGVAYTLQIVGQRDTDPTLASILMSLESVFAVLSGAIFGEMLTIREGLGCVLMFGAIIISQLPERKR